MRSIEVIEEFLHDVVISSEISAMLGGHAARALYR
jgi:hypothetical protein